MKLKQFYHDRPDRSITSASSPAPHLCSNSNQLGGTSSGGQASRGCVCLPPFLARRAMADSSRPISRCWHVVKPQFPPPSFEVWRQVRQDRRERLRQMMPTLPPDLIELLVTGGAR